LWRDSGVQPLLGVVTSAEETSGFSGLDRQESPALPAEVDSFEVSEHNFEEFVVEVRRRLARALPAAIRIDEAPDAIGEAVAWAWENRDRLPTLRNPYGYLYRLAVNAGRDQLKRAGSAGGGLPAVPSGRIPEVEPGLVPALMILSPSQREAVWLVHGCEWSYAETATALGISESAVGTHLSRGLEKLRQQLTGGPSDD
jgi:DNA-directed RNA polymerase specialized sigma24 family protein